MMPYSDPEERLKRNREWRKERTPEYFRWLYQRRSLVKRQRNVYADALGLIADAGPQEDGPARVARVALETGEQLAKRTGNRYDHENNEPYWDESGDE